MLPSFFVLILRICCDHNFFFTAENKDNSFHQLLWWCSLFTKTPSENEDWKTNRLTSVGNVQ